MLIGDQTILHLQIEQQKNQRVYWPDMKDKIGESIELLKMSNIDTIFDNTNNTLKISLQILITTFDTGYLVLPPLPFIYDVVNDSVYKTVETEAQLLGVHAVKVDLEKGIIDIKPILDEPWNWKELIPMLLFILGLLLVIALIIYIWIRVKNKKPIFSLPKKPAIPAHITAIKQLDMLKTKKLWQNGENKAYFSELTDIMRTYMEGQMNFNAMEMVSDDIMEVLRTKSLDKTLLESTNEVLKLADFVKFAKTQALASENQDAMNWAYDFVEKTKPQEIVSNENKEGKQ
jgi:hypothetical protein